MGRTLLVLLLVTLLPLTVFPQTGEVEGYVADAESRLPLSGASIIMQDDKTDHTDAFGRFLLPAIAPGQYELIVSHIGYKTEILPLEVKPGIRSGIHVNLHKASLSLSEVRISSRRNYGISSLGALDIQLRPVHTSQDVLRMVPGLFIAQHAGGGKAEQIFLRGFDLDHGTDIAVTVDGMPVNMVSHAHGQGYADLHFLIPETLEKVSFDKGPYFAEKGNLATAAFVDFQTREFLEQNSLKLEAGRFHTQRIVGQLKMLAKDNGKSRQQWYSAAEYYKTDGYFNSPQDFHRLNLFTKFNAWYGNQSQLTISASAFDSKWNASGQIPDRAVRSGMIGRFGSIDDTEGGTTSRFNASVLYRKQGKNNWKNTHHIYFSHYGFNLFSNFTFFLDDPVNGDMIRQFEKRNIFGYSTTGEKSWLIGPIKAHTGWGAGFRHDAVQDIRLSKASRTRFGQDLQKGDIRETNGFLYLNQDLELSAKWTVHAGLRIDQFRFSYRDELQNNPGFRNRSRATLSPKLNFEYTVSPEIRFFLHNGIGFHSNDTRVILDRAADKILPKVYGTDLGVVVKPAKQLLLKAAFWHLYSEQEFVYVGDAGIVEASGQSRRIGVDFSARYQFTNWLFGDLDLNLAHPRAIGETKGEDHIPLAPLFTSIGGITAKNKEGLSGSLRYRLISNRPANETNTVKAEGYFLMDLLLSYPFRKLTLTLSAENLLNREWREAQFDTESRLRNEAGPVSEIHYTPGAPRFIKAGIRFDF